MKAIIRTHVKVPQRLETLRATILSARRAAFSTIMVIDDQSPLAEQVQALTEELDCAYVMTAGTPGTKNGLYWSLVHDAGDDLHLCDDVQMAYTDWVKTPPSSAWWVASYFACYHRDTARDWWMYPVKDFYAALACKFHPNFRAEFIKEMDSARALGYEIPAQDDILVKEICLKNQMEIWNTGWDYAQHTGIGHNTTFEGPHDSNYRSNFFVGERSNL